MSAFFIGKILSFLRSFRNTNVSNFSRYNGAKGILIKVDEDDPDFALANPSKTILLRKSNYKFKTNSIEFGCVRENKTPGWSS